ncbi:WD40 repeat domain-containing protein [Hirschia litorea]|uniref:WD40 repeat domain-containing protein n=1 Tax=Hirschia litorea TaxID=1199156 RepID=A0ABW2IMJ4_9PROT
MSLQPIQINFGLVGDYMNAKINQRLVGSTFAATNTQQTSASSSEVKAEKAAGTPPWNDEISKDDILKIAYSTLKSGSLISASDLRKAQSSSEDSPKLFVAYEALEKLHTLATAIKEGDLPEHYYDRAEKRLNEGLAEISEFLGNVDIKASTILQGERLSSASSEVAIARTSYDFTTKMLHEGGVDEPVAAWAGLSGFDITLKRTNTTDNLTVDLSSLADNERTLTNVTDLINAQIEAVGGSTRFAPQKIGTPDSVGVIPGDDWGMKISGSQSEQLTFSASASAQPALYVVGASGSTDAQTAQLSKWTDLASGSPTRSLTALLSAEDTMVDNENIAAKFLADKDGTVPETVQKAQHNDTKFIATAAGPDGSVYALAETKGSINGQILRSDEDLVLTKYDSTGREVWSRMIGNTGEITGSSLAVAADGRVAIGGATNTDLTSSATGGEKDGFVMMFSAAGIETSTRQQGTRYNDEVTALAFDSTGALYVGGKTNGSMDGQVNAGQQDAYVEKLDILGQRMWINQWGTAEQDAVTAITIDDNDIAIVATKTDNQAVVQSVSGAEFTASDWSHSLGDGTISSIDWDNGSLYAAGETRYDGRTAGVFSGNVQPDPDAFAIKLDVAGTNVTEGWYSAFGGDNAQTASSITVSNGTVFLSGTARESFGATSIATDETNTIVTSINAATGSENWSSTLSGRNGTSSSAGMAFSANGASDLDAFGLPNGTLSTGDTSYVTDRTTARPGDHFYISVNDGSKKKIEIEAGDTYRALTFKINAALVLDGKAEARRGSDGQTLRITPNENVKITLSKGSNGQDLLESLGLPQGVLYALDVNSDEDSSSDAPPLVTLGLKPEITLNKDTTDKEKESLATMLDTAMRGLRKAYRYAIKDPTLLSLENGGTKGKSTQATAYQTAQLANLQAGLTRLQGGSTTA